MFGVIAMIAQIDRDNPSLPIQLNAQGGCQTGKVAFGTQEAVQQDDGSVIINKFWCIKVRPWQGDRGRVL
jgi:hypothetical protein